MIKLRLKLRPLKLNFGFGQLFDFGRFIVGGQDHNSSRGVGHDGFPLDFLLCDVNKDLTVLIIVGALPILLIGSSPVATVAMTNLNAGSITLPSIHFT